MPTILKTRVESTRQRMLQTVLITILEYLRKYHCKNHRAPTALETILGNATEEPTPDRVENPTVYYHAK